MEATIKSTNYPRPKKASGNSDFSKLAATFPKILILKRSGRNLIKLKLFGIGLPIRSRPSSNLGVSIEN
jgi:hypothetical protein